MVEYKKVLAGVGASAVVSLVWEACPDKSQYRLAKLAGSPLAFLEHYHWGLASLIVGRYAKQHSPYFDGLGAGLIVLECGQADPFGVGKPTFGASTALGIALGTVLLLSM